MGTMKTASLICQCGGTVWGTTPVMATIMSASALNRMYMDR